MITILRAYGLRVVIYRFDHEPAHVHVHGEGEAKILLTGTDGLPELIDAGRMKRGDVRKAMAAVTENQELLLELWRQIHG